MNDQTEHDERTQAIAIPVVPESGDQLRARNMPGTSMLSPTPAAQPVVTHHLRRDPKMYEGGDRKDTVLDANATVVLQFKPTGLCHVMTLSTPTIVGRVTELINQPLLKAQRHGVSRQHCRFWRDDDRLCVLDLGSKNGTFLNGERLTPNKEYALAEGDQMALGTLHLTIHFSTQDKK